ncbi:hypothetical protein FRC11_009920 [Ceratobasidium sp. 423]|nr:hypothetical protein FRC11_009920 [Ceratobasidium sp. 423]
MDQPHLASMSDMERRHHEIRVQKIYDEYYRESKALYSGNENFDIFSFERDDYSEDNQAALREAINALVHWKHQALEAESQRYEARIAVIKYKYKIDVGAKK